MMSETQDKSFENQLKAILDRSVEEIDENTRYRLQMARAEVLQLAQTNQPWFKKWYSWAGVAGRTERVYREVLGV